MKCINVRLILLFSLFWSRTALGHDTTHIHPLLTHEIAELIKSTDSISAYTEIYIDNENGVRELWGIDHDQDVGIDLNQSYLIEDQLNLYKQYDNAIDGVVQEDAPSLNVLDHFYHAKSGIGLTHDLLPTTKPSPRIAMAFFNEAVDRMGGYHEESVKTAFFEFGQALHHVEDMISPAHIHNDVENALFDPVLRYSPGKNTHVLIYTLRFFHGQSLALSPTGSFSEALI